MKNIITYITSAVLFLLLFIPFTNADWGPGMMGGNYGGFGYGFGVIFMIVFWGLVIYVIFLFTNDNNKKDIKETPLDILKKRLASGEITEEEFEKLKAKI